LEEVINKTIEYLFLKNGLVAIPVFSTILLILFKAVSYRGEYDSDTVKAMFNVRLALATAGIFVLLTNISFSIAPNINRYPDKINNLVYRNFYMDNIMWSYTSYE